MSTPEIKKNDNSDKTYNNGSGHIIKKGETASEIVRDHQIYLELLKKLNPEIDLDDIDVGDILVFKKTPPQVPTKFQEKSSTKAPTSTQNNETTKTNIKTELNCKSSTDIANSTGLSKKYIEEIMKHESFSPTAYKCSAGKLTIGYGHRIYGDKRFNPRSKISKTQAMNILAEDLLKAKSELKKAIGDVKLTKPQEEALVDIVFNAGGNNMIANAPNLKKALKEGRMEDAACELDFICITENKNGKSAKSVSEGLCIRRLKNMETFCDGVFTPKIVAKANEIKEKMFGAYDNKFKSQTTDKNRDYILNRKDSSTLVVTELIERCSKKCRVPQAQPVKIEEKSTWQKIKDWWNSW